LKEKLSSKNLFNKLIFLCKMGIIASIFRCLNRDRESWFKIEEIEQDDSCLVVYYTRVSLTETVSLLAIARHFLCSGAIFWSKPDHKFLSIYLRK